MPSSQDNLLVDFEPDSVLGLMDTAAMEDEPSSLPGGRKVDLRSSCAKVLDYCADCGSPNTLSNAQVKPTV